MVDNHIVFAFECNDDCIIAVRANGYECLQPFSISGSENNFIKQLVASNFVGSVITSGLSWIINKISNKEKARNNYIELKHDIDHLTEKEICNLYHELGIENLAYDIFENPFKCQNCKDKEFCKLLKKHGLKKLSYVDKQSLYTLFKEEYYRQKQKNKHDQDTKWLIEPESISVATSEVISIAVENNNFEIEISQALDYSYRDIKQLAADEEYGEDPIVVRHHKEIEDGDIHASYYCLDYHNRQQILERRKAAIKQLLENKNSYHTKDYELQFEVEQFLRAHHINPDNFKKVTGNQLQHVLHCEVIDIASQVYNMEYHGEGENQVDALKELILDFGNAACLFNKVGSQIKSIGFLDWCWTALDYGKAFVEGIGDAAVNVANMVLDPVGTVVGMIYGLVGIGAFVGDLIVDCADIGVSKIIAEHFYYMDGIRESAEERIDRRCDQLASKVSAVYNCAKNYVAKNSGPELVRHGTSFVLEMIILRGAFKGVGKFCGKVGPYITKFTEKLKKGESITALTAEGMNIPIVCEAMAAAEYASQVGRGIASSPVGRAAANIVKKFRLVCESEMAKMARKFRNKTRLINKMVVRRLGPRIIVDTKSLMHIFDLEIARKVNGFHHDYLSKLYKSGRIAYEGLVTCKKTGAYKIYRLIYKGKRYGPAKTFFPSHWTREKVVEKILESLQRGNVVIGSDGSGTLKIQSFTKCGLKIESIVKNGRLVTAYPILDYLR